MKVLGTLAGLVVLLTGVGLGASLTVGGKAPNFELKDVRTGQSVNWSAVGKGKTGVIIFIATQCPYSNAFNEVMAKVAEKYRARGVVFAGINSNRTEDLAEVKSHAESHGFPFAVLKDPSNQVADLFGASVTPEVFVVGGDGTVLYHGALGNSRNPTTRKEEANAQELEAALEEILAGRPVTVATTKMFGCTIKR